MCIGFMMALGGGAGGGRAVPSMVVLNAAETNLDDVRLIGEQPSMKHNKVSNHPVMHSFEAFIFGTEKTFTAFG